LFSKSSKDLYIHQLREKTMQNRRISSAALALMLLLAISTTAVGQAGTNCDPGQIMTPCSSALQATNPGETSTPPATTTGQIETPPAASDDASLTEIAASMLFTIMSLF
jgi:hypothetical protein